MMREHYASERIAGQRSKKGNGTHSLQLKQLQRNQTYEVNRPGTGTPVYHHLPPPSRVLSAHLRSFAIGRSYRDSPNQIWDRIESAV